MRSLLRTTLAVTLLSTSLAAGAWAAGGFTPPSTSLKEAKGGKYLLDKFHANIVFSVSHLGFSQYIGRFNALDGTLMFDAKTPEKSGVKITIDTHSVDTNNHKLEGKLRDALFLDSKQFPTASFTSTRLEKHSDTKGRLTGDLTLKGVTRPVVLDVTFNGAGLNPFAGTPTLGFSATGSFKRSDFGIKEYLPAVGDDIRLTIEVEFNHEKEA